MKFKSILLCMLLFGIFIQSCSSDDDGITNQAPHSFDLIDVADGATDVALQPKLTWQTANDPDGDDVSYQVYLDTQDPPQITVANKLEVSRFNLEEELEFGTTYYWMVVAKDTHGNTTKSMTASFTTIVNISEAILGKWFYDSVEGPGAEPITDCDKKTSYNFLGSGVVEVNLYYPNSDDVCELNREITSDYEIISQNEISIVGDQGNQTVNVEIKDSVLSITSNGTTMNLKR